MTQPVSPSGPPPREPRSTPRGPWLRRHQFAASLSAVAILACAVGAAGATWQLNRVDQHQQQISRAQARLTSAVHQLNQNAVTLSAGPYLSRTLGTMRDHLAAEASAWAHERHASCPERSTRSRVIISDTAYVVSGLMELQAGIQSLHAQLSRVQRNLGAVEREVAAIRSLGGQVIHDPSSAIYLGHKALHDTRQTAQEEFKAGSTLAERATKLARMATAYARKAGC